MTNKMNTAADRDRRQRNGHAECVEEICIGGSRWGY